MDAQESREIEHRFTTLETNQRNMETKIDDLPDYIVLKLSAAFPSKSECADRHRDTSGGFPWGKILPGVITLITVIVWGWFGFPGIPPVAGTPLIPMSAAK